MRKLALDVGSRSCGIAISDHFNLFASPIENFKFEEQDFDVLIKRLQLILDEYEIDEIIVGYPLRLTGTKSPTTLMIEDFVAKFKASINLQNYKIIYVDERNTTQQAMQHLKQANLSHSKSKKKKDVMAAVIMLNNYLQNY